MRRDLKQMELTALDGLLLKLEAAGVRTEIGCARGSARREAVRACVCHASSEVLFR